MDIILYLSNLQRISLFDVSNKPEVIRGGSRTLVSVRVVIDNAVLYIYIYIYIYIIHIYISVCKHVYSMQVISNPKKSDVPHVVKQSSYRNVRQRQQQDHYAVFYGLIPIMIWPKNNKNTGKN